MPGTLPVDLSFANSLRNTLGPIPARGQFLLTKSQIDAINLNARHTAIWTDDSARTVTAYNLIVTREPIKTGYARKAGDANSCFLVEVSDARWLCKNPTFAVSINEQYNVRAPGWQGDYYTDSTNGGTAWTWTGMVEDIWNKMSTQLGTYPGLPITPDGTPEGFIFPGCSAWDALTEVLTRIGCAVRWNPTASSSQYSIVQVGATDASTTTALASIESRLVHDAEFQPVILGKVPYGVRVYFHRLEQDYGSERTTPKDSNQWQTASVYNVDVVGPDSASAESGIYHPIWDDLPAIYDTSGSLTNSSALNTRAQERSDDFYRMLRSVGGQRLYQAYSGVVGLYPGSTLKTVTWRLDGQAALLTEVIRHPFLDPEYDRPGTMAIGNLNLNQPFYGPSKPVYSPLEQIVKVANGTPSGGVYDCTIEQLTTAPNTWTSRESIYVVDLGGAVSLTLGNRYKARLVGYHSSRPLYAINTANSSGLSGSGDATITGNYTFDGGTTTTVNGDLVLGDGTTTTNVTFDKTNVSFEGNSTITYSSDSTTTFNGDLIVNVPIYYGDSTISIGTTQNNWNPGSTTLISVSLTADTTVTGLVPTDATKNETRYIVNTSTTYSLFIECNSSSSTAGNRFYRPISVPMRLPPGQGVCIRYDSTNTQWYFISPPQPTEGHTYSATISATTNDQETESSEIIRITPSGADRTLTGLDNVLRGAPFIIENPDTTYNLILADNDAGSGSGKKFNIPTGDETIEPGGMRIGIYDETNGVVKVIPGTSGTYTGGNGGLEEWKLYEIDETDLDAFTASMDETLTLATLGQNVYVDQVLYNITEAFAGGASLNPAVSISVDDGTNTYTDSSILIDTTSTKTVLSTALQEKTMAYGANASLKARIVDSGANLDEFTTGHIQIWIKYVALAKA